MMPARLLLALLLAFGAVLLCPRPGPRAPDSRDLRVLQRLTCAPSAADLAAVRSTGLEAYLEEQLDPPPTVDPIAKPYLARFPLYGMTPAQVYAYVWERGTPVPVDPSCGPGAHRVLDFTPIHEHLVRQRLITCALTRYPLRELMVDFWMNHFSVAFDKDEVVAAWEGDLEDQLRTHAMGRFRDLLGIAAHSPAMLVYLDNAKSDANTRGGLNENYARELLELHTVGLQAGYAQKDVRETARCMTGWTIEDERGDGVDGPAATTIWSFRFKPAMHAAGNKTVMGHRIPEGGVAEGEALLDMLARHPATARTIATKLARRFVCDDPPPALVDRLTATYLASDGDIRAMLSVLLASEELRDERYAGAKVKTMPELVAGALRVAFPAGHPAYDALCVPLDQCSERDDTAARMTPMEEDAAELVRILQRGGAPYNWTAPTGWPDVEATWLSTHAIQQRLQAMLLVARLAGDASDRLAVELSSVEFQSR